MPGKVRFIYSGIRVRNLARSVRFYQRLGFKTVKRGGFSHGGRWIHLAMPGSPHRIELNYYPKGTAFYAPFRAGTEFDHFGFYTPNPRAWLRSAVRAGAKPMVGFVDGDQHLLFVRDPDGVWLGAYGPARPRPPNRTGTRRPKRRAAASGARRPRARRATRPVA